MPLKIITVDDSKTMRDMVSFTLKEAGYDVLTAEDGKDAVRVLEVNRVDVVITDLNMPNMNGIELIRAIRAMPTLKTVPVLMLTTEADEAKKTAGKEAGATGWIVKPFNPEKLISVIQRVAGG